MGLYEVPLSVSLLGFGIRTMLANFHVWGIMFFVKSRFKHTCEECESKRAYVFYVPHILSGPCELLFFLCFIASWT